MRLVGAPPSAIGKFGGDTDNWMWPRHTGDFSVFRIYADADNQPADYSPDNVPYRPRHWFPVSTAGMDEGDFTFVYGCPGSTREYVTSDHVARVMVSNPNKIRMRTERLDIINAAMAADPAVRIKYASKAANIANAWKNGRVRASDWNALVRSERNAPMRSASPGGPPDSRSMRGYWSVCGALTRPATGLRMQRISIRREFSPSN